MIATILSIPRAPAAALLALLLLACDPSSPDGSGSSGLAPVDAPELPSGTYRTEGDLFLLTQGPDTAWGCDGSRVSADVRPRRTDTSEFLLAGDSLIRSSRPVRYAPPDLMYRIRVAYARVGSGKALEGAWRSGPLRPEFVAGGWTDSLRAQVRSSLEALNRRAAFTTLDVVLRSGDAYVRSLTRETDYFLAEWNGDFGAIGLPDSAAFAVKVEVKGIRTLELTGLRNGERVQVEFGERRKTYSSSNPARAPYVPHITEAGCSQDPAVNWYTTFLEENRKAGTPANLP